MNRRIAPYVLLITLLALPACSPPATVVTENEARNLPAPLTETVLYELYVRSFTPEGTFRAIIPRLAELRSLGVTTIWLMPIHPVGEIERKGTLGSPYSIVDYRAINPEFGTMEDFQALLEAVHAEGMHLILDLVANHTAWDHRWVTENPDWYLTDDEGTITHPPGTDWYDVAALDFSRPEVRAAMLDEMRFWVEEVGIDGYRADVAELVPEDFWTEAIAELRAIRPVLMLAEGHVPSLHEAGFDLTYSWDSYHAMKLVWQGAPADTLAQIASREEAAYPPNGRLRFTTNHDETAWDASPLELFDGTAGAQAAAVIVATLPGVPLIYNGQEVGDPQQLPLFEQVAIDWDADPQMRAFYEDLLARRAASRALQRGAFEPIDHELGRDVLAFRRVAGDAVATVVVNVRNAAAVVEVPGLDPLALEPYGWRILE